MVKKISDNVSVISEDLNGLLHQYKEYNTYFRVCVNNEEKLIRLQMTANPAYWRNIPEEWNRNYVDLKRIELDVSTMFVNYIAPVHIVGVHGPCLGIKFPLSQIRIFNGLNDEENGFYLIAAPVRFLPDIILFLKRMVKMPPQIKLQMIEKVQTGGI